MRESGRVSIQYDRDTMDERDTVTAAMERLFSPPTASARVQ